MKQMKRVLALLLAVAMMLTMLPTVALADTKTYEGEDAVTVKWTKATRATSYKLSLYFNGESNPIFEQSFSNDVFSCDITDYVKQYGEGKYIASIVAMRGKYQARYSESNFNAYQLSTPAAPSVTINETTANVTWAAVANAKNYDVKVTLSKKDGTVVAAKSYEDVTATSLNVTEFVKAYAANDEALVLSASVKAVGSLKVSNFKCYLSSEWSEEGKAAKYVGALPELDITTEAVKAEPNKLYIEYEFEDADIDYTYVESVELTLTCQVGGKTVTYNTTVNPVKESDKVYVTDIKGNAGDYTVAAIINAKYVGNADTNYNDGVNYTITDLPAAVLTVADDASTITWAPVVAGETTFDDADRYEVFIKTPGSDWQEYTDSAIEEDGDDFVVDISSKLAEGEKKSFKVVLNNKLSDSDVIDLRYTDDSEAVVEIYKAIQPTNVAFDVVTKAANDIVLATWTAPSSIEGIDHFVVTIYKDGEEVDSYDSVAANAVSVDVTGSIDAENVNDYTFDVQSIGKHLSGAHFDADSGVTVKSEAVKSGAVASVENPVISEVGGKLILTVNVVDTNSNMDKVDSFVLSEFTNGKTSYNEPLVGKLSDDKKTVTFDLSEFYGDDTNKKTTLQSSSGWSGKVTTYSKNAGLNADTESDFTVGFMREKLETPELNVNLENGEITWDAVENADSYKVLVLYKLGYGWKAVNGEDGETVTTGTYNIDDKSDNEDGGLVPGRVYEVQVIAESDTPLMYEESEVGSAQVCKFPAVSATMQYKGSNSTYLNGRVRWGDDSEYDYPSDVKVLVEAGSYSKQVAGAKGKYCDVYTLVKEDGTFDVTVTVLGEVYNDINYVNSDKSNEVRVYTGIVPTEPMDAPEFKFEAGEKLSLSFVLPTEADFTTEYDKAMANAIDEVVTVKIYSDSETLLGTYVDSDADGVLDVTIANEISSSQNLFEYIKNDAGVSIEIEIGSITKYVEGATAEFDVDVPQRPSLTVEPTVDNETGRVSFKLDEAAQADGAIEEVKLAQVSIGTVHHDVDVYFDDVENEFYFDTDEWITSGVEGTAEIIMTDTNGVYNDNDQVQIKLYKLVDPQDVAITKLAKLSYTKDATSYAYDEVVSFDDTDATYNAETQYVSFNLAKDAVDVEITVKFVGGYDSANDIYVIDADNTDSTSIAAGILPEFELDGGVYLKADGTQALDIKTDVTNPIYQADETGVNNDTPVAWSSYKVVATDAEGNVRTGKIIYKATEANSDAKWSTGNATVVFPDPLEENVEYTLVVIDAVKPVYYKNELGTSYIHVGGYELGKVTYKSNTLNVSDLKVVDNETGNATWTGDENAEKYIITVERLDDEGWVGVKNTEITDTSYVLDDSKGYEAGKLYRLTVVAHTEDPNYNDGKASIQIYRLMAPVAVSVSKSTGLFTFTKDKTYASIDEISFNIAGEAYDGAQYNAGTKKITFDLDVESQNITTVIASKGTYDEANKVYTLDAKTNSSIDTVAGLAPEFSIVEDENGNIIHLDENNNQYVIFKIDNTDLLYPTADISNTYSHVFQFNKINITADNGVKTIVRTLDFDNFDADTATIKVYYDKDITEGVEYTFSIATVIKSSFKAVAGADSYVISGVTYEANKLAVENLKVSDFETGEITWTAAEHAGSYEVLVEKYLDGQWVAAYANPVTVTEASYLFGGEGYVAGETYRVTVKAISNHLDYADSDAKSITVYRLTDPQITNVSKANGEVSFNADENALSNIVTTNDGDAKVNEFIVTFDLASIAQTVKVTLTSKGGEKSSTEFILDANNAADADVAAGLLPKIAVDGAPYLNDAGVQCLDVKIANYDDINWVAYGADQIDLTKLIIVAKDAAGNTRTGTIAAADVNAAEGTATIKFNDPLIEGTNYTITVDDKNAVVAGYKAVAGKNKSYKIADGIGFASIYLSVNNLKVVNNVDGTAAWDADENAESYEIVVERFDDDEWVGIKKASTTDTSYVLNDAKGYESGKLYRLTVTATSTDPNCQDSEPAQIEIYRLMAPVAVSVNKSTGVFTFTKDTKYASIDEVSFKLDGEAYDGAEYTASTNKIKFDLTVESQNVTTVIASKGTYDEEAMVYTLDAETDSSIDTVAGLAPVFSIVEDENGNIVHKNESGKQYIVLKIDNADLLYPTENITDTYQHVFNFAKTLITANDGNKNVERYLDFANFDADTATIKVFYDTDIVEGIEYSFKIKPAMKTQFKAVAASNAYELDSVTYEANKLAITNLKVSDFATGEVTWTAVEHAGSYDVTVEKQIGGGWTAYKNANVTDASYMIDGEGFEAGETYKVTVKAISNHLDYADSDAESITVYRLIDPTIKSVSTQTGDVSYTADENAITNTVTTNDVDAIVTEFNVQFDLTVAAQTVKVTLTSKGGEKSSTEFILDAYNAANMDVAAGLLTKLTVNGGLYLNESGVQCLNVKIANAKDINYKAYGAAPIDFTKLVFVATDAAGNTRKGTIAKTDFDAVAGTATVKFNDALEEGVKYTITVNDENAIKAAYAAVEGKNAVYAIAKNIAFKSIYLNVNNLAVNNFDNGNATWDADVNAESYNIVVERFEADEWIGVKNTSVTTNEYVLDDATGYEAGKLYRLTVVATSTDPNCQDSEPAQILIYKLVDPSNAEISTKNGLLTFKADEAGYAFSNEVSFALDGEAYTGAEYNADTKKVTFDKKVESQNVTTVITSVGGYDAEKLVYVLNADNNTSVDTIAGLAPKFSLVMDKYKNYIHTEGEKQYIVLQMDTADLLYPTEGADVEANHVFAFANTKVTAAADGETSVTVALDFANFDAKKGTIKVYFDAATLNTAKTYTFSISTSIAANYKAVAGNEKYTLGSVVYDEKQLVVDTLNVKADAYATGDIEWNVKNDKAQVAGYLVDVQYENGGVWTSVLTEKISTTDKFYNFSENENITFEAGKEYKVLVQALSKNEDYADSEWKEITLYRLANPTGAAVDTATGALTFTKDETYASTDSVTFNPATKASYDYGTGIVTFDLTGTPNWVTTSVKSLGGYDGDNDVYVLDSLKAATTKTMAGLLPSFTLTDGEIYVDDEGQYILLTANIKNNLYNKTVEEKNAIDFANLVITAKDEFENTYVGTPSLEKLDTGLVRVSFSATLESDKEYTVTISSVAKDAYKAVAGESTYDLGDGNKVKFKSVSISELVLEDLVVDTTDGTIGWFYVEKADKFKIVVEAQKPNTEEYETVIDEAKVDADDILLNMVAPEYEPLPNYIYDLDAALDTGLVPGTKYRVTIVAQGEDLEDSEPQVVYLCKLVAPSTITITDTVNPFYTVINEVKYPAYMVKSTETNGTLISNVAYGDDLTVLTNTEINESLIYADGTDTKKSTKGYNVFYYEITEELKNSEELQVVYFNAYVQGGLDEGVYFIDSDLFEKNSGSYNKNTNVTGISSKYSYKVGQVPAVTIDPYLDCYAEIACNNNLMLFEDGEGSKFAPYDEAEMTITYKSAHNGGLEITIETPIVGYYYTADLSPFGKAGFIFDLSDYIDDMIDYTFDYTVTVYAARSSVNSDNVIEGTIDYGMTLTYGTFKSFDGKVNTKDASTLYFNALSDTAIKKIYDGYCVEIYCDSNSNHYTFGKNDIFDKKRIEEDTTAPEYHAMRTTSLQTVVGGEWIVKITVTPNDEHYNNTVFVFDDLDGDSVLVPPAYPASYSVVIGILKTW